MNPDTRQPWEYKGITIIPTGIFGPYGRTHVEVSEHKRFGTRYQSRWWRIDFPDSTWVEVSSKEDARRYIDNLDARNTPGQTWKNIRRYLRTIAGI